MLRNSISELILNLRLYVYHEVGAAKPIELRNLP
jgi:hypothetical protein